MANSVLVKLNSLRISCAPLCLAASVSARTTTTKHYNPKFKWHRAQKFLKIDLPNFNEKWDELPQYKVRQKLKERGLLPLRPWIERHFVISCTGGTFEAYVPPEGDGKASLVSSARAKQTVQLIEKKSKSMMAIRKIKSFDEDFDAKVFSKKAQEIYVKAHEAVANHDRHALQLYATERAYPELRHNSLDKTIHWKLLSELEEPRVVHARCTDVVTKENIYAQVTVRFHTQQQLAVYDRFGRLMYGSEFVAKDVLEYIVFEKHLADTYGVWRLHDKIVPTWMPPRPPSFITKVRNETPIDVGLSEEKNIEEENKETPQIADK